MKRIVFATGGTGGHIYPALAVAQALEALGYTPLFVGGQGGMEAKLVPEVGYPFYGVRTGKWDRSRPDPRQGLRALLGLKDALGILKERQPQAVIGFGGFASFPALAAASWLRLPIILHEQNAFPGRVTHLFAGRAALVAVSKEARAHLKGVARAIEVGLPVRERRLDKVEARQQLGLPERGLVTLIMGGSQGSLTLNQWVPRAYTRLAEPVREGLTVLHSSGPRWQEAVQRAVANLEHYHVLPYVDATLAWSAADLAITRAGMGTLAEAAFHGVPLVMVPLPSAAENHQLHNAIAVERAGAGRVVQEAALEQLASTWRALLDDGARQGAATAAAELSPAGAARRFATLIDETLQTGHRVLPGQESL